MMKVPYTVVIGVQEVEKGELTPRLRQDIAVADKRISVGTEEFLKTVANEAKSRVNKSSF